jgi:two-component system, NarL family, sensor histidine kinase DesK
MSSTDFAEVPDRTNPVGLLPWLVLIAGPISDIATGRTHPAWLATAGLVAFAVLYVATIWCRLRLGRPRTAYALAAVLAGVTIAMSLGFGVTMTSTLFPLLALACGAVLPWRRLAIGPPLPVAIALLTAGAAALITWAKHGSGSDIWQACYGTVLAGFIVAIFLRFFEAIAELRRTRTELAAAAVDAERLRFGRDMHDLLGHTLSVMVIKAQAVRKLTSIDPEAAAAQAADIEEVGRRALSEVRLAVSGYRGRGLSKELDAARTALTDAGLESATRIETGPLSAEIDSLFGWVVREGVTNVIKHSGARRCDINVGRRDDLVMVEITDDGDASGSGLPSGGHGLDGLRERVAVAGGTLTAGPLRDGGFRLAVAVPVPVEATA